MRKTKIEWCDITINPVVGCSRGCPYCYAKKLNNRFKFVEDFSKLQLFLERLKQIDKIKNKIIFMNSMSDIYLWEEGTIAKIYKSVLKNQSNTYIFLTKSYGHDLYDFLKSENVFIGLTVDNFASFFSNDFIGQRHINTYFNFINLEPLLSKAEVLQNATFFNSMKWLIIGAETGNRKDKVIPKREWIENILRDLKEIGYTGKIFMKNNLKDIYPDLELIQEFPFERSK